MVSTPLEDGASLTPRTRSQQSFITAATQTHSQPLRVAPELAATTLGLLLVYSG